MRNEEIFGCSGEKKALPKFNMEPKNDGFKRMYYLRVSFSGSILSFGRVGEIILPSYMGI